MTMDLFVEDFQMKIHINIFNSKDLHPKSNILQPVQKVHAFSMCQCHQSWLVQQSTLTKISPSHFNPSHSPMLSNLNQLQSWLITPASNSWPMQAESSTLQLAETTLHSQWSPLVGELKMVSNTISLRIHGDQSGERKVMLELLLLLRAGESVESNLWLNIQLQIDQFI